MIFIQVYVRNALKILLSKKWCFFDFFIFLRSCKLAKSAF